MVRVRPGPLTAGFVGLSLLLAATGCSSGTPSDERSGAEPVRPAATEVSQSTETIEQPDGFTVVVLERTRLEIPDTALPASATVTAREITTESSSELFDGFTPAGAGIDVSIEGGTLSEAATVYFDVTEPPTSAQALPVAMHIADDGSWSIEPARLVDGQLVIDTTEFSSWIPGFLRPIIDLVSSALGSVGRLAGLRSSPPDCRQPEPWALFDGTDSAAVHACMSANGDGIPELVIKSNRGYWLQVNVPEPNLWVWVSNIASGAHSYALGGSGRYLLPPGETMTIGMPRPEAATREFTVGLERNNRTLALSAFSMWFGDAGYVGELYTLGRCAYDGWGDVGGFIPNATKAFGCSVSGLSGLDDPEKAFAAAEEVFGQARVSDADQGEALSRLSGKFGKLGAVLKFFTSGLNAITGVDSVSDLVAEPWVGATVRARLLPPAPEAPTTSAATTPTAPPATTAPTSPRPTTTNPPVAPTTSPPPNQSEPAAPTIAAFDAVVSASNVRMAASIGWVDGTDPITCTFLVDGAVVLSQQCGTTPSYTVTMSPGTHRFQLQVCDRLGRCSMSSSVTRDVGSFTPVAPSRTYPATAGGLVNTWTNYANAGGTAGPQVQRYETVQISCRLEGFRVADGNTWWYRIASPGWNNTYYGSADAFYNNGQMSGSLRGTPFFDPAIPPC